MPCGITNCPHDKCTRFVHHHRPKPKDAAARRAAEKKKKQEGKRKKGSVRWTLCTVHLIAGECGVDLPHGHCPCTIDNHPEIQDMMDVYIEETTVEEDEEKLLVHDRKQAIIEAAVEYEYEEAKIAELQEVFGSDEFVISAYTNIIPHEKVELSKDRAPVTSVLPTAVKSTSPNMRNLTATAVPATPSESTDEESEAELKESFDAWGEVGPGNTSADDTDASIMSDTSSSDDESDEEARFVWLEPESVKHETKEMTLFFSTEWSGESLGFGTKIKNWLKKQIPFSSTEERHASNKSDVDVYMEGLTLESSATTHVRQFWETTVHTPKMTLAKAQPAPLALFAEMLPSQSRALVYSDLFRDGSQDSNLCCLGAITGDGQISRALGPLVRAYVHTRAAEIGGEPRDATIMVNTTVALMNQFTARGLVMYMAQTPKINRLDFRPGAQLATSY